MISGNYLDRNDIPIGSTSRIMSSYTKLMNLINGGEMSEVFDTVKIKDALYNHMGTRFCCDNNKAISLFDKQLNKRMAALPDLAKAVEYKLIN